MATINFSELDDKALVHHMLQTERDLVDGRFKHSLNQLENTASLRDLRRSIARARTELRAREIAKGEGPNTLTRAHRGSFVAGAVAAGDKKEGFLSGVVDKLSGAE